MEQDPGLPTHTVYRPQDLSKLKGQKLPILAWGNRACANAGDSFKNFLTEIASHGFLAIAIGPISTATPKPSSAIAGRGTQWAERSSVDVLTASRRDRLGHH